MQIIDILTNYWMIILPAAIVLIVVVVVLVRKGYLSKLDFFGFGIELDRDKIGKSRVPPVFARSDSSEFVTYGEGLLRQARRIILIGTGINLLQRDPVFIAVAERAARGDCDLEIYMANPYSPAIEMRLVEEESGPMKPPVGQSGLIQRLRTMLDTLSQMGQPANFTIKLFSHYPTFAMFIIDDDYFFYPYGYALLGNFSPVAHYRKGKAADLPMVEFLEGQYRRTKAASVDAQLIFDLRKGGKLSPDKLKAFAVYLIPEANAPLYKFGSKVLGYYVRERFSEASPWAAHIGSAAAFGFHLTVADALYFADQNEVDSLTKEIEFLASGLKAFRLTNLQVKDAYPNRHSIALTCQDESGALEALHHELVFRAYRRAVASNYTLGSGDADRDPNHVRNRFMIQRYRAPYILGRFQPHLSLMTGVAPGGMEAAASEVRALFKEMVPSDYLDVRSIVVMARPSPTQPWEIAKEIWLA